MPETNSCTNNPHSPGQWQAPAHKCPSLCARPRVPAGPQEEVATKDAVSWGSIGAAQSISWAGTALPLAACATIWGLGSSSPATAAWLSFAHGLIGTAASAWTVLQLFHKWRTPRSLRKPVPFLSKASLLALYGLLAMQSLLAMAASMLHGEEATLFWIRLPSVLHANAIAAFEIDRLHGCNALLLLGLITMHIRGALRALRRQRLTP